MGSTATVISVAESMRIGAFILGTANGPHPQPRHPGLLRYYFPITLIPVEPVEDLHTELSVVVTRLWRIGLSGGSMRVDTPEGETALVKRLWHWAAAQVPGLIAQLVTGEGAELRLTESDLDRLSALVPEKLTFAPESQIPLTKGALMPRQVFISCGQVTSEEITLGKEIEALVSSLPGLHGYFAQNQDSPAGVTEHILKALNGSAAMICVMNRRGEVTGRDGKKSYRASLWIEQEIAIAAFMQQVLNRSIPIRIYCENGIAVEGIRRQIMVHPVPFERGQDILEDLRSWLLKLKDTPTTERGS